MHLKSLSLLLILSISSSALALPSGLLLDLDQVITPEFMSQFENTEPVYSYDKKSKIALRFAGEIITRDQIEHYAEILYLEEETKIAYFESSESFQDYEELKQKFIEKNYEKALKLYTYSAILEQHLKIRNPLLASVIATKAKEMQDVLTATENKALKTVGYPDNGEGIRHAWEEFGAFLKKNNYPHVKTQTNKDVYFSWHESQKAKIKEKLNIQRYTKYLYFLISEFYDPKNPLKPHFDLQVADFYKAAKAKIGIQTKGSMSAAELNELIAAHPEVRVIIGSVQKSDFSRTPVKLLNLDQSAKAKAAYESYVIKPLNSKRVNEIVSYLQKAKDLAGANDLKTLKKKAQFHIEEFYFQKKGYDNYLLAQILTVAQDIKSGVLVLPSKEKLKKQMDTAISSLAQKLTQIGEQENLLKTVIANSVGKVLPATNGNIIKLVSALSRFDLLKLQKNFEFDAEVQVSNFESDIQLFNKIEAYLENQYVISRNELLHQDHEFQLFVDAYFELSGVPSEQILNYVRENEITRNFQ